MATMAAELRSETSPDSLALPPDAEAWRAVEQRDVRYDGRFVYAVLSTRIYCRPSCPSRRPRRDRVAFFGDTSGAEAAGFRACLRCKPGSPRTAPGVDAVARAREYLERHPSRPIPLAELAAHSGLSTYHLQRSFKRLLGVSPKEYHAALRATSFKARLRAGDTVSRATYEAGYGSSSRVYEHADRTLGMTPAAYRRGGAGMHIQYTLGDSPAGRVLVGTTTRGVCAVSLGESDVELVHGLRADFPKATFEAATGKPHAWVTAVLRRVQRPRAMAAGAIPLDVNGTAFQWQVWKALQAIPSGTRRSYSDVAAAIKRPTAARAVARACASNRVAVVIPCHRVVRESGELGGYRWGIDRKQQLLDGERE
jgi:AraC family transcriptional regulator, regulatory protein of adaptative response / methylated-DNA-[protein]-cysteine methyltransferase